MTPQFGDTVFIGGTHLGFTKGKTGNVVGRIVDGRIPVMLKGGYIARVRPQNLKLLLDVFKRGAEK